MGTPGGRYVLALTILLGAILPAAGGSWFYSRERMVREAFRDYEGRYVLYVSKSDFRLSVFNRHLMEVDRFTVGYGDNPDRKTKLHEGDRRTPEGIYRVVEVLSRDAPRRSKSYRKLAALNRANLLARDGFHKYGKPDADTGRNAYGPRLFWLDYPNADDRARYERALGLGMIPLDGTRKTRGIGHGITIHGNNDPPSVGTLSSSGCIIMRNRDILRLGRYVKKGTPVVISIR